MPQRFSVGWSAILGFLGFRVFRVFRVLGFRGLGFRVDAV